MARDSAQSSDTVSRRTFVTGAGGAGLMLLAGCSEAGGDGGSGSSDSGNGGGDGGNNGGGSGDGGSMNLSGDISITGSSTVFPLATAVAEEFQNMHPDVNIDLQSTGSGGGFENFFCPGDSDINNASRPIKQEEIENCEGNGITPHEIKVATDALTVVVNNDNDFATELTVDQLAQIWGPDADEDQTWADINPEWPDETIQRFGAAETSGTFDYLTEVINGEEGAHTQAYEPTENDRAIVQGVRGSEYAIGYFGFSYYFNNQDTVTAVAVDDGDGAVEPSLESARTGQYTPLSRPLFTYPSDESLAEEQIAEFCRFFIEQSTNQELVANQVGYVPNTEDEAETELEELEAAIESAG